MYGQVPDGKFARNLAKISDLVCPKMNSAYFERPALPKKTGFYLLRNGHFFRTPGVKKKSKKSASRGDRIHPPDGLLGVACTTQLSRPNLYL